MGFIVVQDPQTFKPYRVQIAGDTPTESEKQEIQQFIEQQKNFPDYIWILRKLNLLVFI